MLDLEKYDKIVKNYKKVAKQEYPLADLWKLGSSLVNDIKNKSLIQCKEKAIVYLRHH